MACHLYALFRVPDKTKHEKIIIMHYISNVVYGELQADKLKYTSHNNLEMICSGVKLSTSFVITLKTFLPRHTTPDFLTLKYNLDEGERINVFVHLLDY